MVCIFFTTYFGVVSSRRMRWAGLEAHVGEKMINECRILLLKPKGKRALGKPKRSREDNIKGCIK